MTVLFLASPLLAVVLLLASGRVDTMRAGAAGAALALLVAATAAPLPLSPADLGREVLKGLWLAWLAATVIFGGLFFQQVLHRMDDRAESDSIPAPLDRHRQLYAACFLIGPFAESATGFGVGYVIALALIMRDAKIPPLPLLLFGLFSQILVPWGALAVGTMVGARLGGLAPQMLGFRSALLTLPLLAVWLVMFWRFAAAAGLRLNLGQMADDAVWTIAGGALLLGTNRLLDPEVAAVAALGPLIVVRFWRDARPDVAGWRGAGRAAAPYAALAAALIAGRAIPPLHDLLATQAVLRPPIEGAAGWAVLLHPFLWLMAVPVAWAGLRGHGGAVLPALLGTWSRGRTAVVATVLFLVMSQLLAGSGIARGLAAALASALGPAAAVVAAPLFAAIGGLVTGSTTGSNSLFMPSQMALAAAAGLADGGWLAAIQNTTASALTMLSPIRVAMGCAMLGRPDLERPTYAAGWALAALPLLLMIIAAVALLWERT